MNTLQNIQKQPFILFNFIVQVVHGFINNKGFLLSAAVAYYTLLSTVPLSILAITVLTNFIDNQPLIQTLSTYLEMVIPGYAALLTEQVKSFLENRKTVSAIGFLGLLFFSSLAFSMLENAMSVIFFQPVRAKRRNFFLSAIIPYFFIIIIGIGIIIVSFIVGTIETLESHQSNILGWNLALGSATGTSLYILGITGEILMFTSIYLVMPVTRIRLSHALIGGITATFLWEIIRRVLIWNYTTISMVNIIYGSIAITVVALLIIEVVAIILLLGAQVIAELERKNNKTDTGEISL
jgi:membrane protein